MKNVQFVYECDSGFFAKAIRWFTKFPYNHIASTYDSNDWNTKWVAEAALKGVRAIPDKGRNWRAVVTPTYPEITEHMRQEGHYIGCKYELKAIFIFAIIIVFWKWLKIKIRKPHWKAKDQICSEYMGRVVSRKLPEEVKDPQWTSPRDLFEVFERHPKLFKIEILDDKVKPRGY